MYVDIKSIVLGLYKVTIEGYNFGMSLKDILQVSINNKNCSRIDFVSNSISTGNTVSNSFFTSKVHKLICYVTMFENGVTIKDEDVSIKTTHGSFTGIHLQPLTIANGLSDRTVISRISYDVIPFRPYSLYYDHDSNNTINDVISTVDTIYWTDLASHSISRCDVNGKNYYQVYGNVSNACLIVLG
jgi:hypothetical protein